MSSWCSFKNHEKLKQRHPKMYPRIDPAAALCLTPAAPGRSLRPGPSSRPAELGGLQTYCRWTSWLLPLPCGLKTLQRFAPLGNHGKPLLVGVYKGSIILLGFVGAGFRPSVGLGPRHVVLLAWWERGFPTTTSTPSKITRAPRSARLAKAERQTNKRRQV